MAVVICSFSVITETYDQSLICINISFPGRARTSLTVTEEEREEEEWEKGLQLGVHLAHCVSRQSSKGSGWLIGE